ncbi:hypothetical protein D3C78_1954840 [compost metagenome]
MLPEATSSWRRLMVARYKARHNVVMSIQLVRGTAMATAPATMRKTKPEATQNRSITGWCLSLKE